MLLMNVKLLNKIYLQLPFFGPLEIIFSFDAYPEYVKEILSGRKKYEYRKIKPKNSVDAMVIYSSAPVMKIVAEVEVEEIIEGNTDEIWEKTKNGSGTNKKLYDEYFKNKNIAVAYKLGEVKVYETPKKLTEFGLNHAPQSYVYL